MKCLNFKKELCPDGQAMKIRMAQKAAGGTARNGRKGAPWFTLNTGESRVLAHAENTSGIIRRIWITINDQTPDTLRGLRLEMFWDNCDKPAVDVPFGDFFCVGLGKVATFKNALFSNSLKDAASAHIFQCHLKLV